MPSVETCTVFRKIVRLDGPSPVRTCYLDVFLTPGSADLMVVFFSSWLLWEIWPGPSSDGSPLFDSVWDLSWDRRGRAGVKGGGSPARPVPGARGLGEEDTELDFCATQSCRCLVGHVGG